MFHHRRAVLTTTLLLAAFFAVLFLLGLTSVAAARRAQEINSDSAVAERPLPVTGSEAPQAADDTDLGPLGTQEVASHTTHQYFIPFDDRELRDLLDASDECQPSPSADPTWVGDFLASNISITSSADDTRVYYDQWEDGYDADPFVPLGTTLVFTLHAGEVRFISVDIDTTVSPWNSVLQFGGGDRITVRGGEVAVVRSVSPGSDSDIGTRLAGAWEVEEAAEWDTVYVIPAGEDWGAGSDFEFSGASVTALNDGTQLFHNSTPIMTLAAGGIYMFDGVGDGTGLRSGDIISATGPIQVHSYSSVCTLAPGQFWSGNGYNLEPLSQWSSGYWSPVPDRLSCSTAGVDIFLYNHSNSDIALTVDDGTQHAVQLPPGSSSVVDLISPDSLSTVNGVHLTGDGPFWGLVNVDTRWWEYEWGYSLIAEDDLSSLVVLGWAPGNANITPTLQFPPNGNMAWVTPITDTAVFFDLDQDGTPDRIDCNGDGDANDPNVGICDETTSDQGVPLLRGQTLRAGDPFDADLTGAAIYSQAFSDSIAVAWGEAPCVAEPGVPYLDLGYTVLPIGRHFLDITKADEPDPVIPGQLLTYTLLWEVQGDEPAPGVFVSDTLPLPYVSFVSCAPLDQCDGETSPGSGVVSWHLGDRLPHNSGLVYDSGWLTLTVRVDQRPPGGVFTNTVIIDDETDVPPAEDDEPTLVPDASYALSKERVTPSPVEIGDTVQFLIAITNTGALSITHLPLEDTYDPVYLEYVSSLPQADSVSPGVLVWDDLTSVLPGYGFVLPPAESTQVLVEFTAITSTQHLDPPVTVNTAVSEGALTAAGELPRQEDDADVGILDEGSTAIELLYFRASPSKGGVLIEWATLFEVNTARFWLYRSQDTDFNSAVSVIVLPARGWLDAGATYQYLDPGLAPGEYHYWLVEEENSGKRTVFGPVSATSGWDKADFPFKVYLLAIQ
jgi:hypothetical protein